MPDGLRRAFLAAVALAGGLAVLGLVVFPSALADLPHALPGLAGVALVLAGYAALAAWGGPRLVRRDARLLRLVLIFGLLAGAVYAVEVVLEYLLLPADNTPYGLVEFGLVFALYLLAGGAAGWLTRRAGNGLWAAVGAALVSTLLWYVVVLAVTYVMHGTPQQTAVFRAEGNYDDFARSSATDFQAWVLEDFYGAGFFHMLLGPLIAALLGSVGGLAGRLLAPRR